MFVSIRSLDDTMTMAAETLMMLDVCLLLVTCILVILVIPVVALLQRMLMPVL